MLLLLLLQGKPEDKDKLKEIVNFTFESFQKLANGIENNFLQKIDEIPLYKENSVKYSELFIESVKELTLLQNIIIDRIDSINNFNLFEVGLSNYSLKIKVQLLEESIKKINNIIPSYADFGLSNFVALFIEGIDNLLNIYDSLKTIIPILDPLIELLKVLSGLLKQLKK